MLSGWQSLARSSTQRMTAGFLVLQFPNVVLLMVVMESLTYGASITGGLSRSFADFVEVSTNLPEEIRRPAR
jgi:hypothetical protein